MSEYFEKKYLNKRVKIENTDKVSYITNKVVGLSGVVERIHKDEIGVRVDGKRNSYSAVGIFWFEEKEIKILENESEDNAMEGFTHVAIVNLLEDYNNKDYAFALYEDDYRMIMNVEEVNAPAMVVVNPRAKDKRCLATVKDIIPIDFYAGTKVTAEVVGVVNMNNYIHREEEKVRLKELAKKRAAIEAELEKEINKRKSIEYYEEMAKQYADNPRLAELVCELRVLGA